MKVIEIVGAPERLSQVTPGSMFKWGFNHVALKIEQDLNTGHAKCVLLDEGTQFSVYCPGIVDGIPCDITVQPVKIVDKVSHWVNHTDLEEGGTYVYCHNCGTKQNPSSSLSLAYKSRFCHHCGHEMTNTAHPPVISREEILRIHYSSGEVVK